MLTFKEYIEPAMRTANKEAIDDAERYANVKYSEECFELAGLIAKEHYHKMPIEKNEYIKEIGDAFWFLAFRNKYCEFGGFWGGSTNHIDLDYKLIINTDKRISGFDILKSIEGSNKLTIDEILMFMNFKGITLSEVLNCNLKKLWKRYPNGYSHKDCERRADVNGR